MVGKLLSLIPKTRRRLADRTEPVNSDPAPPFRKQESLYDLVDNLCEEIQDQIKGSVEKHLDSISDTEVNNQEFEIKRFIDEVYINVNANIKRNIENYDRQKLDDEFFVEFKKFDKLYRDFERNVIAYKERLAELSELSEFTIIQSDNATANENDEKVRQIMEGHKNHYEQIKIYSRQMLDLEAFPDFPKSEVNENE